MTRSIAGRQRNGRLVAASMGLVGVLAGGALAGCGAGQIASTADIVAAVPGGEVNVPAPTTVNPNGALEIKNVTVDYNDVAGYAKGDTAPLSMWIANQSTVPLTVTPGAAQLINPTKTGQLTPLGTIALSSGTPVVQDAPSAGSPTASVSVPPSASGSASAGGSLTVEPGTLVVLSVSAGSNVQHMQLPQLKQALVPGNTVLMTFNITQNGNPLQSAVVTAPIAPPEAPAPRVSDSGFPPSSPSS